MKFVSGCSYEFEHNGKRANVRVDGYDAIDKMYVVSRNNRQFRLDLPNAKNVRRARRRPTKTNTENVFLYVCSIGQGKVKVGVSSNPSAREKQIRTCSGDAKMLHAFKLPRAQSMHWAKYERKVLREFSRFRKEEGAGREVLTVAGDDLKRLISHMKRVSAMSSVA